MRLRLLFEDNTFIVWKWMSGKNWKVNTREGSIGKGDDIIPLYVCGNFEQLGIFWNLVYNNLADGDSIYLAEIYGNYDPDLVTDRKFITYDYDFTTTHEKGSKAFVGVPSDEESLIMTKCRLVKLFLATVNNDSIILSDKFGNKQYIKI